MKTIFVGIAAYNETDTVDTIISCLENAKYPDRLRFGVWNHSNGTISPTISSSQAKEVRAEYSCMLGVGLSRMNALSMYDDEDYYLQIDAHMLFEKNWDEKIIQGFNKIQLAYDKPIISTYTPWWSRAENGEINFYSPESNSVCSPMTYDHDILNEGFPKQKTHVIDWDKHNYYEHFGISAHFLFAEGRFIYDVLPDPFIMFSGEEPTTAVRAWTRGYRMFAIKDPIAWHKNKFHGVVSRFDRIKYGGDPELVRHYMRKDIKSLKRTEDILTGETLGYWGAPTLELLQDYQKSAQINFREFYKKVWRQNV